jgi:hypothetical protein
MRQYESLLFAEGGVKFLIEAVRVLVDELVLSAARV